MEERQTWDAASPEAQELLNSEWFARMWEGATSLVDLSSGDIPFDIAMEISGAILYHRRMVDQQDFMDGYRLSLMEAKL